MIPKVTVVGSVGLDNVTTPEGSREEMLGGSASHFSVSASFQTKVGMVGVVGDDFGQENIDFLEAHGVDLEGLEIVKDAKTFRWAGSYMNDLNAADTHSTDLNVFADFEPKVPADYAQAPILFLANIHPALQLHVIEQMPNSYKICDTMNLWIDITKDDLEKVLRKVNIAILNDGEAKMLTGLDNLILAGRKIMEYGLNYCIIKKGEHGAMAFGKDDFFATVPSYPVEVVFDPTGAGDSFAGGFTSYLAEVDVIDDKSIIKAMRQGTIMGSFNVSDFSCDRFRTLTKDEINTRLAKFESYING